MSLTEAEHVYAAIHEDGINDFMTAFFTARPRYLTYATPGLAPATPYTSVPVIAFPGIVGGIEYMVSLGIPVIDLHPNSGGAAHPLPPGPGQFTIETKVTITVGCRKEIGKPSAATAQFPSPMTPLTTDLEVYVRGGLIVNYYGPGTGNISFQLNDVEIVDISPDSLESVIECVLRMILQAVLLNVHLPFHVITIGAVSLTLLRGPEIEEDQIKVYGDV